MLNDKKRYTIELENQALCIIFEYVLMFASKYMGVRLLSFYLYYPLSHIYIHMEIQQEFMIGLVLYILN